MGVFFKTEGRGLVLLHATFCRKRVYIKSIENGGMCMHVCKACVCVVCVYMCVHVCVCV